MRVTCDCCSRSAHFDAFTTSDLARNPRARTVVYHDPRQQQLLDLAHEGDECAEADLFKERVAR